MRITFGMKRKEVLTAKRELIRILIKALRLLQVSREIITYRTI